jgi:sigma-B regulation protein RsbU (phosphoserine phosphatase)
MTIINLAQIKLNYQLSVNDIRKKVWQLGKILTNDNIIASRLSAIISQVVRLYIKSGINPVLTLKLLDTNNRVPVLSLHFITENKLVLPQSIYAFFDQVNASISKENIQIIIANYTLNQLNNLTEQLIEKSKDIFEQKTRDQLMEELEEKNETLKDTIRNLKRTRRDKERMESELNIGHDIQMSMLPLVFPPFPERNEFDIFASLTAAREVGGDFYDFFFVDEDNLCFCVGDVSGKGVPAALFMAVTKTLVKSRVMSDRSTASVITHANNELSEDNENCMFVTMWTGILNTKTGEIIYTNASHNPPYIKRKNGEVERLKERHGPVVGAMEGMTYKQGKISLAQGDVLFLFTDGVTEAMNREQELYDETRLVEFLQSSQYDTMEQLTRNTIKSVKQFENGAPQADDITILTLKFNGIPEAMNFKTLNITIKNDLEEIERVNDTFDEFAEENNVPLKIARKMNLVFDELLNNTISYAYEDENEHEIEIVIELSQERLVIIIMDDGIPFNPLEMETPDTELDIEEREIGGLGIHLVRNMMDEVDYKRQTNKNVFTAIIKLS